MADLETPILILQDALIQLDESMSRKPYAHATPVYANEKQERFYQNIKQNQAEQKEALNLAIDILTQANKPGATQKITFIPINPDTDKKIGHLTILRENGISFAPIHGGRYGIFRKGEKTYEIPKGHTPTLKEIEENFGALTLRDFW